MMNSLLLSVFDAIRFVSGFSAKNATVDKYNWSYIERPGKDEQDTDVVVFLHGFSSMKESWVRVARGVDKRYKIVIPDLPGQGRTTPVDALANYSMPSQAERLHEFLEKELPAHKDPLGGLLHGWHVGWGLRRNVPGSGQVADDGVSGSPARSRKIPHVISSIIASEREKQLPVLEKIVGDSLQNPTVLEDLLPNIRAKTLVMWGKHDRVLDVSSVEVLEKKLTPEAQGQVLLFDDCGHILQHEKYAECTAAINKFLAGEALSVKTLM